MPLAEDDVEEVDPEPALARILDHDHDALVIGPGPAAGPRDRRARPRPARPAAGDGRLRRRSSTPRRCARSPRRTAGGRACAGRSSSRRTSASSPGCGPRRGSRPEPTATSSRTTRPRCDAALDAAATGVRSSSSRAPARSSPRRTARPRWRPSRTPASRPAEPATSSPGRSGRCWPRAWRRIDAARLGVHLHGMAGEAVRARLGDAGLLAGDLPLEIALARRRLAAIAERRRRRPGRVPRRDAPRSRRRPASAPAAGRRRRSGVTGGATCRRAPIEARLRAAGLPALPRTAWLEIDLDAPRGERRGDPRRAAGRRARDRRQGRRLRARRRAPAAAALAAGARGLCVATLDEALELRAGGIRGPVLVLFPIPPDGAPAAARAGVEITAGDAGLPERCARRATPRARRRARRELPAARGPARPGDRPRARRPHRRGGGRGGRGDRGDARRRARAAPGTHLQAPGDRARTDAPGRPLRGRRRGPAPGRRRGAAPPRPRRPAGCSRSSGWWRVAGRSSTGSASAWRPTASLPTGSPIGAGAAGLHARSSPGALAARPADPRRRPARGRRDQLRPDVRHGPARAGSRRCPLGYADGWSRSPLEPGDGPRPRACESRSSATSRWTPSWRT